jgi:hypothetical protein
MAMNAVLAIIANGGRAIVVIYTLREEINYFLLYFIDSDKTNPLQRGSRGWGMFLHQNHGAGGGNGPVMVGMFVCLCLASQNLFEREFFVPARTDLGVKLLRPRCHFLSIFRCMLIYAFQTSQPTVAPPNQTVEYSLKQHRHDR